MTEPTTDHQSRSAARRLLDLVKRAVEGMPWTDDQSEIASRAVQFITAKSALAIWQPDVVSITSLEDGDVDHSNS